MPENKTNNCPIIFLAFANDQEAKNQYLRNLPEELKAIRAALNSASKAGLCELLERANVSIKEIYDVFQEYGDRIAIFHYGGHSNSYEFLLEADNQISSPAFAKSLVPFLAKQPALEMVFLNGCSTELHAEELILGGIPSVIGTSQEISDEIAFRIAIRFYKGLGQGLGITTSWEDAISEIKTWKGDDPRGTLLRDEAQKSSQFPWELFIRSGAENIKNWNLPMAVNNPLFGLPDISDTYDLPDTPYRFLERYKKEDAKIFFGRGAAIRELYQKITGNKSSPVILFSGQSGVGKSSLLEAGLFPRLESTHHIFYIRRIQKLGLKESLQQAFINKNPAFSGKSFDLPTAWNNIETESKKPLVILLDQIEEIFTRPNYDLIHELKDFLNVIKNVFNNPNNRPKGKLILSYRKEYHTNIRDAISAFRIPKDYVSLDRFSKLEIQAIVKGLTSSEALKNKYSLEVDKELPSIIADNLWKDKDTPIAPVLQIILTKLWQQQAAQNQNKGTLHKVFSVDNYNRLLDEGILLDDFFQQQMSKIQSWENAYGKTTYESGLALDILYFHTTDLGSAESRSLEHLRQEYEHRAEVLDTLIVRFKELYLLTNTFDNKNIALAHDTLAPIVQKAIRDSDKPGQRAKRILESKAIDFDLNPDTYVDEEDLALVEQGADGMRIWNKKEKEIIEKSRKRRALIEAERRRNEEDKKQSILLGNVLS